MQALEGAAYPNDPWYSHVLKRHALLQAPFYVCPGSDWTASAIRNCRAGGGEDTPDYYCSSWGCEQTGLDIIRKDRDRIIFIYKSL